MEFKVGKEIDSGIYKQPKCPNCKKGRLYPKNGSNSYTAFLLPDHPNSATNHWICSECRSKFEVIIKD